MKTKKYWKYPYVAILKIQMKNKRIINRYLHTRVRGE